jgi:hypothetical protein
LKEGDSPIPGTKLLVIDYSDADAIAATLDAKAVDTVISALGLAGGEGQLKLIAGAKKAPSTRRFIPSEYAAYTPPEYVESWCTIYREALKCLPDSLVLRRTSSPPTSYAQ